MRKIYISRNAGSPLVEFLTEQGYEINTVTEYGIVNHNTNEIESALGLVRDDDGNRRATRKLHVDSRIAAHPDIYMCQLGLWSEAGLFIGDPEKLHCGYPNDIIYNAVCTRDYVLHLLEKTDPDLMDAIVTWRRNLAAHQQHSRDSSLHNETKVIGVRQGYTRCMCLPVDNSSFIVSDEALSKPLESQGADVLLIEKGHILLEGFDYGFIGGTAGNIYVRSDDGSDQKAIIFNGDLSVHPDFKAITSFIKSRNILPIWFDDYALEDIGSIIAIE